MKLITDDKIPFVRRLFTECDTIVELPAHAITSNHLKDAQILLTRTVTPIGPELLSHSAIQFVGSAATGTDHIDLDWIKQTSIALATAEGANASAVVDYVISCIAALKKQLSNPQNMKMAPTEARVPTSALYSCTAHFQAGVHSKRPAHFHGKIAGVIGCGRIGSKVAAALSQLGFQVMCYDPFLTKNTSSNFVDLNTLLATADLITIHTPLTKTGQHPTFHLLNHDELQCMKPNSVLINTARGSVINEAALLKATHITVCLDVWEQEPVINLALLNRVFIGTPHIAGYTLEAKYHATEMVYEAAARHFGWDKKSVETRPCAPWVFIAQKPNIVQLHQAWEDRVLAVHDPVKRTAQLREAIQARHDTETIADTFTQQRNLPYRQALDPYHYS